MSKLLGTGSSLGRSLFDGMKGILHYSSIRSYP